MSTWADKMIRQNQQLMAEVNQLKKELAATFDVDPEDAWDRGYASGHSRAMRMMSDEPNVEPGVNPYRTARP